MEDLFWLSFLILIIILSIVKSTTRIGWSQFIYVICGSVIGLIVVYLSASIINKFCFDDASTAHWNAHARFTQAALAQRLHQEEHKVHVIAPPRMGGAKLNILYTVGDVPITVPTKGIITPQLSTEKSCPQRMTTANDSPTATATTETPQNIAHKNNSKSGGNCGDLSPNYELPEPPNYAKTTETLFEEQEKY